MMFSLSAIAILAPLLTIQVGFGYSLILAFVLYLTGLLSLPTSYLVYRLLPGPHSIVMESIIIALIHTLISLTIDVVFPSVRGGVMFALPMTAVSLLLIMYPKITTGVWRQGFGPRFLSVFRSISYIVLFVVVFGFFREFLSLGSISLPGILTEPLLVLPEFANPRIRLFLIPGSVFLILGFGAALWRKISRNKASEGDTASVVPRIGDAE